MSDDSKLMRLAERAARLGLEIRPVGDDAWQVYHPVAGLTPGVIRNKDCLEYFISCVKDLRRANLLLLRREVFRHEAWCPLAYGAGWTCYCNPTVKVVDDFHEFARIVHCGLRSRAEQRAAANAARRTEQ